MPTKPKTVRAIGNPRYRAILNRGNLNVADGMSVVWALRLNGHKTARIPGTEALSLLVAETTPRDVRHYFYGGAAPTVRLLQDRLRSLYPSINVSGAESPPFRDLTDEELRQAADRIRASGADLLRGRSRGEPRGRRVRVVPGRWSRG